MCCRGGFAETSVRFFMMAFGSVGFEKQANDGLVCLRGKL
jgi:hypothetical protein